ncbi:Uncharacterized protein FWK35_00013233 [Aphis craccivora]|uniref:Uncharacterized protein n=1 Tax=Aphis craccivora TaxID=307492 RepID=A0A6G0YYD9_APHCR|nr:Uncharacterized protein FWK35_00013233 [Aphis craccivora]
MGSKTVKAIFLNTYPRSSNLLYKSKFKQLVKLLKKWSGFSIRDFQSFKTADYKYLLWLKCVGGSKNPVLILYLKKQGSQTYGPQAGSGPQSFLHRPTKLINILNEVMNHNYSRNNAPISNYGGGFRCKSEYPWCIIEFSKKSKKNKKIKMTEKREFLLKTTFRPNRFFLWFVDKKFLDDQKVLKI